MYVKKLRLVLILSFFCSVFLSWNWRMYKTNTLVCKHCSNLNVLRSKTDQLPTNHFLRDNRLPSRPIICPILSKTQCKSCFEYGHTRSYCTQNVFPKLGYKLMKKPNPFLDTTPLVYLPTTPSCSPPSSVHEDEDLHDEEIRN
jgi:hypothetical protein